MSAGRVNPDTGMVPDTDPDPQQAAIRAFWADARIRGKINRISVIGGAGISETLPPPAWSFGEDPQQADRLLELVLTGRKTATASALRDYEVTTRQLYTEQQAEDAGDLLVETRTEVLLPDPGMLSIVLDGRGAPRALIRITDVQVVGFGDVDAEHARREGEGDGSLDFWRATHRDFFERSGGEPVSDSTPVVLERFEVLVPAAAQRAARRRGLA